MEKYFEEWDGSQYPVRVIPIDESNGAGSPVNVADYELWAAIEADYEDDKSEKHAKAVALDNDIFYYCDSGFIASDPTDDEVREYLKKADQIE